MNGLWQLKTATVFKYVDMVETKCFKQTHQHSTVAIIIFADFCGVTLSTIFSTANLKCVGYTIHYMVLKWLKLQWLHTLNRKWDSVKESRKKIITNSNTIIGLIPAVSYWN